MDLPVFIVYVTSVPEGGGTKKEKIREVEWTEQNETTCTTSSNDDDDDEESEYSRLETRLARKRRCLTEFVQPSAASSRCYCSCCCDSDAEDVMACMTLTRRNESAGERERKKVFLRNADASQVEKAQNQSSSFFFLLLNSIIDSFTHCTRDNYHPADGSLSIEIVRISALMISLAVTSELT